MSQLILKSVRVEKSEIYNGTNYTVVITPAPDAFSHPSKFRISSKVPFATVGQVLSLSCNVRGFVRPKSYIDKQTGLQKSYDECDVYLDFVEIINDPDLVKPSKSGLPNGVQVQ